MYKRFLLALAVTLPAVHALAQDQPLEPQLVPLDKSLQAPPGEKGEVTNFIVNCYTNVSDCYGRAYFKNNSNQYTSHAIFYNNGSNGRSNFVLAPGQDHWISGIRYNDTYASAWGNSGVPDGTQRYYIYVCCN